MLRILLALTTLTICNAEAQLNTRQFMTISTENGLSHNGITAIYQGSRGYMWFGTFDGLNRYDGYEVKSYTPEYAASNPGHLTINKIVEDSCGTLWLATNAGLYSFSTTSGNFQHHSILPTEDDENTAISSLELSGQSIWLCGAKKRLLLYNIQEKTVQNFSHSLNNVRGLNDIHVLDENYLLLASNNHGLVKFDIKKKKLINAKGSIEKVKGRSNAVYQILKDGHTIWLAARLGLFRLNIKSGHYEQIYSLDPGGSKYGLTCLARDHQGNIWFGTDAQGLFSYSMETGVTSHFMSISNHANVLPTNIIRSLFVDLEGILWIGTWRGVSYSPALYSNIGHFVETVDNQSTFSSNLIWTFYEDRQGLVWFGTDNGVNCLDMISGHNKTYLVEQNLEKPATIVMAVTSDSRNTFWFGTDKGLFYKKTADAYPIPYKEKFDTEYDFSWKVNANSIRSLVCHRDTLWVGTMNGLFYIDTENETCRDLRSLMKRSSRYDFVSSMHALCMDSKNRLWIGSDRLFCLSSDRMSIEDQSVLLSSPLPMLEGFIKELSFEEDKDLLWIGTRGHGLVSIDINNGAFKIYTTENGLSHNWITSVQHDDENRTWVSTSHGLSIIPHDSSAITTLYKIDGLQDDEFNTGAGYRLKNGCLLFGGQSGFNVIDTKHIARNTKIPRVVINDIAYLGSDLSLSSLNKEIPEVNFEGPVPTVIIPHHAPPLVISAAALNYHLPAKNQYAYKLEGLDNRWHNLGNKRQITLSGLPPQKYKLKITASNNDGVWNTEGANLVIDIIPPFYKTIWFRTFITIIVLLAIYGLYWLRIIQLKRRQNYLENMVKERTMALDNELTHRKKAEAELQKYSESLEERVSLKTNELLELKHKEFHLEKLAAIGRATSGIVHELRNPLSSIKLGLTTLSKRIAFEQSNQQCVDIAVDNVKRMEMMLKEMLTFSKPHQLELKSIKPSKIISEVVEEDLRPHIPDNVLLLFENHFDGIILGDADKLRQAIKNIVENSLSVLSEGGRITIEAYSPANDTLNIQITDNGPGINPKHLPHVFDPYFSKRHGGTGLGLTLVDKIIKAHGGTVEMTSTLGEGTATYIQIPLNQSVRNISHSNSE